MFIPIQRSRFSLAHRIISLILLICFTVNFSLPSASYAQGMTNLPLLPQGGTYAAGTLIGLTPSYTPILMKGLTIHPENPFKFDFILDSGNAKVSQAEFQNEGLKLAKYFLAGLGSLLLSFVLAHALVFASAYLKASGVSAGLMAGFWNWLGFIVPLTLGSVLWEGKSWKLWTLNNAYYLVQLSIFGIILALWK